MDLAASKNEVLPTFVCALFEVLGSRHEQDLFSEKEKGINNACYDIDQGKGTGIVYLIDPLGGPRPKD